MGLVSPMASYDALGRAHGSPFAYCTYCMPRLVLEVEGAEPELVDHENRTVERERLGQREW